ncbi:MAG: hypothetical protein ACRD4Y_01770 [Candidatus Acidiferrales bacterium]
MIKPADLSAALSELPRELLERWLQLGEMQAAFCEDALATGVPDRARLRECLATYGRLRIDILNYLGEDPESEEFMPKPVALHDS